MISKSLRFGFFCLCIALMHDTLPSSIVQPCCNIRHGMIISEECKEVIQSEKGARMSTRCRYCNSTSYGSGCPHSPTHKHEHRDDEKHCEWCGSSSYGSCCPHSPTGKHRHGEGANKCIWCGSTSSGAGCPHSPTGRHER